MTTLTESREQTAKEYRAKYPDKEIDIVCLDRSINWDRDDDEFADLVWRRRCDEITKTHHSIGNGLWARFRS